MAIIVPSMNVGMATVLIRLHVYKSKKCVIELEEEGGTKRDRKGEREERGGGKYSPLLYKESIRCHSSLNPRSFLGG